MRIGPEAHSAPASLTRWHEWRTAEKFSRGQCTAVDEFIYLLLEELPGTGLVWVSAPESGADVPRVEGPAIDCSKWSMMRITRS